MVCVARFWYSASGDRGSIPTQNNGGIRVSDRLPLLDILKTDVTRVRMPFAGHLPAPPRHAGPHRAVQRRRTSSAHRVLRLKTPCSANQACVIPTPLAIVLAIAKDPYDSCSAGVLVLPSDCPLEDLFWYTDIRRDSYLALGTGPMWMAPQ